MVNGEFAPVAFTDAKMVNGQFVITFPEDKIQNAGGISDNETRLTNNIFIQTSCTSSSGIDPFFDYSKLGETWSTPRIVDCHQTLKQREKTQQMINMLQLWVQEWLIIIYVRALLCLWLN